MDLRNASVERLENGLTVILLEDGNFPVVSVQMLYRVGARDETAGYTGLAHFLEHMAFRDSEHFPDNGLVSSIYAIGGEWHGYTWIDQTTYFATVPKEHLDLLLRIEADRMSRLTISPDDIKAERGAVLAELHMYENDPSSLLLDSVLYASFVAHPYRNNTIGWASDVEHLQHADLVDFYRRHYHPANAVLAVVGDIDSERLRARIVELFGTLARETPTPAPHTLEPVQDGERRVRLHGDSGGRQFMIAYRAPSANSADFAAFLVLQELLGGGGGVNFLQNDWGTAVADGTLLDGAAQNLTTWYPPSAQDYVFTIAGSPTATATEDGIEQEIERRVAAARQRAPDSKALAKAKAGVLDQLVYDVATTEDAAHQLAFFEGLHALDTLLELPDRVAAVTAADLQRVARSYLLPERRTIGWYLPEESGSETPVSDTMRAARPVEASRALAAVDHEPLPPPVTARLSGGIPVIVQQSDLSPAAQLQIVLPGHEAGAGNAESDSPVPGYSSLAYRIRPQQLGEAVQRARASIADAAASGGHAEAPSADPGSRLEQVFAEFMRAGDAATAGPAIPALIVLSGDVQVDDALALLERGFGRLHVATERLRQTASFRPDNVIVRLGRQLAQAQLGYIVPAPAPQDEASGAYRLLLYILSHDYAGRLGDEAITKRGLAYYIDGRYRSDGRSGWITLSVGVDPEKIGPLKNVLTNELARLAAVRPTVAEVGEAKAHFAGRAISGAQDNEEIANRLATQWLWYGGTQTAAALEQRLAGVTYEDVLAVVPAFIDGATIVVKE